MYCLTSYVNHTGISNNFMFFIKKYVGKINQTIKRKPLIYVCTYTFDLHP